MVKLNSRFAARRVPETDDFNDFHFILHAIKNPIRLGNDFADVFVILFRNDAAYARKFCQMPDTLNQFSAKPCAGFLIVLGNEADNAFEVVNGRFGEDYFVVHDATSFFNFVNGLAFTTVERIQSFLDGGDHFETPG